MNATFPKDNREIRDDLHARNPQPGDYWHEMFCPVCVVLAVAAGMVILCEKTKEVDSRHWTFDLAHRHAMTLADFRKRLEYNTIPDHYWASVIPGWGQWAVEAVNREQQ